MEQVPIIELTEIENEIKSILNRMAVTGTKTHEDKRRLMVLRQELTNAALRCNAVSVRLLELHGSIYQGISKTATFEQGVSKVKDVRGLVGKLRSIIVFK